MATTTTPQCDSPPPPAVEEKKKRGRFIIRIKLLGKEERERLKALEALEEESRLKASKERLLQQYHEEQAKRKQGRIKLIALEDLPMPMKGKKKGQQKTTTMKKPQEAPPKKPMGSVGPKRTVQMKKLVLRR